MSTPVTTNKWAGNFDCDFCRRKRLMADEFSRKALEKHRRNGGKLKCKGCAKNAEEEERKAAGARRQKKAEEAVATGDTHQNAEERKCAGTCGQILQHSSFNRNQWTKGEGNSRCRDCVEKAVAAEAQQREASKEATLKAARSKVEAAKKSGNAGAMLKAESELAALEAEKVTGLKPQRMTLGRGRPRRGRR